MSSLPLFEQFPALAERVPWTPLVVAPTAVDLLADLSHSHGIERLYCKREDQTHPVLGGNKVRGLEFLLADALRRKAHALFTFGATGSNHIAATAYHARTFGMSLTALAISQPFAPYVARNLHDGMAADARIVAVNPITAGPRFAFEWLRLRRSGRRVRIIPPGGTTPLSCLGHVNAALELRSQIDAGLLPPPDYLFVSMGSLGTAAGLLLGCRLAGLKTRIVGVVVFNRWFCTAGRCAALARRTLRFMRERDPSVPDMEITRADLDVTSTSLGRGYAHPTLESTALGAHLSSVTLDQTYSSKTLAGALDWIKTHNLQIRNLLYWHTYHYRSPLTADETKSLESKLPRAMRHFVTGK